MKTCVMPSSSATRQACCPPAPPKQASVYSVTSWPRCTLMNLIALAMLATAILRNPSATCEGVCGVPVAFAISPASAANFSRTTPASSGRSPVVPNTFGKYAGWILPSITLQSVTASGPPRR